MKDKVVIVTGAASGMGAADARLLAAEGARVVLTDINPDGQKVADQIGDQALFIEHQISSEQDWERVIATTLERFGALHGLVNNAGIIRLGNVKSTSVQTWQEVMNVNALGTFLGCRHALPEIVKSGGGSIVNMSSSAAMLGVSMVLAYSASKGAVRSLTKAVAMHCVEHKNKVRCNSIHPGGVKTPLARQAAPPPPQGKDGSDYPEPLFIEPEDVANLVLFLLSDESTHINGAELPIDDGDMITPPIPVAELPA